MERNTLLLYSHPDIAYLTDELIEKADELFIKALSFAETEQNRRYIEKEYLSVLFMKAARLPLEHPKREGLIDRLYAGVKAFGISEIRETQTS